MFARYYISYTHFKIIFWQCYSYSYLSIHLFTDSSAQDGWDTGWTGLNSAFSFCWTGCLTKFKKPEAETSSEVMYSYGPQQKAVQKQDDQLEHTYSSYVRIQDVALKTCQRRWMIGKSGERRSGISVLAARHEDDDVSVLLFTHSWREYNCIHTFPKGITAMGYVNSLV